ncbi:hypothetical protein BKA93DRAFT_753576 [Sparassis latifolia]
MSREQEPSASNYDRVGGPAPYGKFVDDALEELKRNGIYRVSSWKDLPVAPTKEKPLYIPFVNAANAIQNICNTKAPKSLDSMAAMIRPDIVCLLGKDGKVVEDEIKSETKKEEDADDSDNERKKDQRNKVRNMLDYGAHRVDIEVRHCPDQTGIIAELDEEAKGKTSVGLHLLSHVHEEVCETTQDTFLVVLWRDLNGNVNTKPTGCCELFLLVNEHWIRTEIGLTGSDLCSSLLSVESIASSGLTHFILAYGCIL